MILLVLLSTIAAAADKSAPKVYGEPDSPGHYQIAVTPARECERLLGDTLYSQEVIKRGVSALAGIAGAKLSPADCLGQTLTQWEREIPAPEFVPAPESGPQPVPSLSKDLTIEVTQLTRKKSCFEGKKSYCKGAPPVSKPEYEAVLKDLRAKRRQIADNWAAVRGVSAFLVAIPQIDNRHYKELVQKFQRCEQKLAEKPEDLRWKCGKEMLTAKEHDALAEKGMAEGNKIYKAETAFRAKKSGLDDELDRIFAQKPELWAKVQALYQAVKCINPYGKENPLADDLQGRPGCGGKITADGAEKARRQAVALLGNGAKIMEEADRRRKESADQIASATARLNTVRNFNYNLRALLARYESFLRRGGKPEKLNAFCRANEREQLRDYAYHAAGQRLGANLISYAGDDRFVDAAQKYGLTEGEISAIYAFTGNFYSRINDAILRKEVTADLENYKSLLESALAKLPPYQAGPLKRFVNFPDDVLKQHKVGNVVCYKSFSSTSKNPDWLWGAKHELLIYPGVKGKDVSRLSNSESEEEVLFTANSCFKVISANGDASKFVLGEVDQRGKVIAKLPKKLDGEQP